MHVCIFWVPPPDHLAKVIIRRNVKIENVPGVGSENVEAVFPLVLEAVDGFVFLPLVGKLKIKKFELLSPSIFRYVPV